VLGQVRQGLLASLDPGLVDELLAAHQEAKRNFYLGGLRLSAVEGGRFCEAAFRLLQQRTKGAFDPLGKQLDTETLIKQLVSGNTSRGDDTTGSNLARARELR
jgi:hypothetical protein